MFDYAAVCFCHGLQAGFCKKIKRDKLEDSRIRKFAPQMAGMVMLPGR